MIERDVLLVADGASTHTRRLTAALLGRGLTVAVAGFEDPDVAGAAFVRLGNRPPHDDSRYGRAIPRLALMIRREQPRVVHGHYISSYGLMAAAAMHLARRRGRGGFVQSAWGADLLMTARRSAVWKWVSAFALRSADLITYDSSDLCEAAEELAPRTRAMRFAWGPERALTLRSDDRVDRIVSARALVPHTRVDLVVEAFLAARNQGRLTGWSLVILGDGPEHARIEAIAAGRADVEMRGTVPLGELRDILASSRIFANVPASDATSATLLDSLALGLIPVVSDLPAYREWIDHRLGEVVSANPTAAELADALDRAANRELNAVDVRRRVADVIWEDEVTRLVAAYAELTHD